MSDIRFVQALGVELERVVGEHTAMAPRSHRVRSRVRRVRLPGWRGRLTVGLVVLAGGSAAAATVLPSRTTQLAARSLSCISGTSAGGARVDTYDVVAGARTPVAACSRVIGRPAATLLACASERFGAVVYERSGRAGQCRSLGNSRECTSAERAPAEASLLMVHRGRLQRQRSAPTTPRPGATTSWSSREGWHVHSALGPSRAGLRPDAGLTSP